MNKKNVQQEEFLIFGIKRTVYDDEIKNIIVYFNKKISYFLISQQQCIFSTENLEHKIKKQKNEADIWKQLLRVYSQVL